MIKTMLYLLLFCILINSVLKLSFWKFWQVGIFSLGVGAFLYGVSDFATEQSQLTISQWLSDTKVLSNMAVLVTIESVIGLFFCFISLKAFYEEKRNRWARILLWFPGVLLFPCLFLGLTESFFFFSGVDFGEVTFAFITLTIAGFLLGAWGFRTLVPERELRLELHLLMSIWVTLMGLAMTASGQIVYVPKSEPINLWLIGKVFLFFTSLFFLGWLLSKIRRR